MTGAFLTRRLTVAGLATMLFFASTVPALRADPITVTSGVFLIDDDGLEFFQFFGTDGLVLGGLFVPTPISPRRTCSSGCPPGTFVSMSTVAGGDAAGGSLGLATGAIVNGTEFQNLPFSLRPESLRLRGELRFDTPVILVPPVQPGFRGIDVPFELQGHVMGFAPDDLDLLVPLFAVHLVGRGTVTLGSALILGELSEANVTYRFSTQPPPVPEPTTVVLFGTGLIGMAARAWRRKRTPQKSS